MILTFSGGAGGACGCGAGTDSLSNIAIADGARTAGIRMEEEALPVVEQRVLDEAHQVGRNDPCPCGSGKKFKHCHGQLA